MTPKYNKGQTVYAIQTDGLAKTFNVIKTTIKETSYYRRLGDNKETILYLCGNNHFYDERDVVITTKELETAIWKFYSLQVFKDADR